MANLTATIMQRLFDTGELRLLPDLSPEMLMAMTGSSAIAGL
jgi:hypothetical protein